MLIYIVVAFSNLDFRQQKKCSQKFVSSNKLRWLKKYFLYLKIGVLFPFQTKSNEICL